VALQNNSATTGKSVLAHSLEETRFSVTLGVISVLNTPSLHVVVFTHGL